MNAAAKGSPHVCAAGSALRQLGSRNDDAIDRRRITELPDGTSGSGLFSTTINAPDTGLAGTVTVDSAPGILQNPAPPAQYLAPLTEQSSAGWV